MAAMVPKWLLVIYLGVIRLSSNFSPLALRIAEIWTFKKTKMAAMVPKWLPVIDVGVISLSSEFQPCSSSNG